MTGAATVPCADLQSEPRPRERVRQTLLERQFPFRELSALAQAERRSTNGVYSAHRWWARRSPAVFRGILLAAAVDAETSADDFWRLYGSESAPLARLRLHDPFMGGGTTLVEGRRLGAIVSGSDIDPLAVEIVTNALKAPNALAVAAGGEALLRYLRERLGTLWASETNGRTPLHYFSLARVTCPRCSVQGLLYKNLILARDVGKHGAVRRDPAVVAFCPECLAIHGIEQDATGIECCGSFPLNTGTHVGQRYRCPSCGERSHHGSLKTGSADRILMAVEDTVQGGRRSFRAPTSNELRLDSEARAVIESTPGLPIPDTAFSIDRTDERPLSFGIKMIRDCFTSRQLALFGLGFGWIRDASLGEDERRALRLALSSALATNNRLCGYATDYGRLAPLFSVRSYAMPWLAVELNPLHPRAGRGSIRSAVDHAILAAQRHGRRYVWSLATGGPESARVSYPAAETSDLRCGSASDNASYPDETADLAVFDPPYFDLIDYGELSEFYRPWLTMGELAGEPVLPGQDDPVESFGLSLGASMTQLAAHVRPTYPLVFTYHSSRREAWDALAVALDSADLAVTCIWPVRSDPEMGHHSGPGNCEWDLVFGVRPAALCERVELDATIAAWVSAVAPLKIREADLRNLSLGLEVAGPRFARVIHPEEGGLHDS